MSDIQILLNWIVLSPYTCSLPSLIGSAEAQDQEAQPVNAMHTAMSHSDTFLLQEMSHSESELDIQLNPGSRAVAESCLALSLLSRMSKLWASQHICAIAHMAASHSGLGPQRPFP